MQAALLASNLLNFSFLPKFWPLFVQGIKYTLLLSASAVLVAIVPALALALMRLSGSRVLRALSGGYIALFRSTPMLVQLYIIYFGVFGAISLPNTKLFGFINLAMFIPGIVALGLNSAAYVAEIFRAGILAVDVGQTEAAHSLGLSRWQTMRFVVLPQAIKNVLPTLANELVTMIKESSVCGVAVGTQEIMWASKAVAGTTHLTISPYLLAAVIYFCINFPAGKLIELLERRMRRGDKR